LSSGSLCSSTRWCVSGVLAKLEHGMIFDDLEDAVTAFSASRNK
jgi:hypothetical protein